MYLQMFTVVKEVTAHLSVATRQGAPADESDRLSASSGRQRETRAGHAQLL